jgi:predicted nucleotide-binding protein (sugar kinase/HSP70/actin superfamily)
MRYAAPPPTRRFRPAGGRIGVPRSLCYDELRRFFDAALAAHGFEIVHAGRSGPATLAAGLARCVDEVCFPLKVFFGHVAALADQGIDTVLVPRLVSLAKGRNLCPKFHVLPDLVESAFPDLHVIAPYVDLHHAKRTALAPHLADAMRPPLVELGAFDGRSKGRLADAWRGELAAAEDGAPAAEAVRIAAVGHLYAERDPFLGLGVVRELGRLGAAVVGSPAVVPEMPSAIEEGMYYEPNVRAARAIERRLCEGADGVVLLTYFACGPDSYAADVIVGRLKARGARVPFLRLILDEQTSTEGLVTRLATFVDVARLGRDARGGARA